MGKAFSVQRLLLIGRDHLGAIKSNGNSDKAISVSVLPRFVKAFLSPGSVMPPAPPWPILRWGLVEENGKKGCGRGRKARQYGSETSIKNPLDIGQLLSYRGRSFWRCSLLLLNFQRRRGVRLQMQCLALAIYDLVFTCSGLLSSSHLNKPLAIKPFRKTQIQRKEC
jgi:hypothetical protein